MVLFRREKNNNKPLIGQIIDLVPRVIFNDLVSKFRSDKGCSRYKSYDQFVAMTFGQQKPLLHCTRKGGT